MGRHDVLLTDRSRPKTLPFQIPTTHQVDPSGPDLSKLCHPTSLAKFRSAIPHWLGFKASGSDNTALRFSREYCWQPKFLISLPCLSVSKLRSNSLTAVNCNRCRRRIITIAVSGDDMAGKHPMSLRLNFLLRDLQI